MTYSIVAHDALTGEMGVAIQSYYYGCGIRTISARPGAGVVVVQMMPDATYAEAGLPRLGNGETPADVLDSLLSKDPGRETRQVAMLDVSGRVAAVTGKGCVAASGHLLGDGCSVQGAMVESARVWEDMLYAFTHTSGALPERMLSSLRAGEAAGGDIRGRRAAAMLVVSTRMSESWPEARPFDIRVDDHPDPLAEMERHLNMQRLMNAVEVGFVRGLMGDMPDALDKYAQLSLTMPDDPDVSMRYGILLAMAGEIAGAREQVRKMEKTHDGWARLTDRLVTAGFLPSDVRVHSQPD